MVVRNEYQGLRRKKSEKRKRKKKRGRDKRMEREKKVLKNGETCLAGKKEGWAWNWEILEMVKVLSLVLTDKRPRNSPESLSLMGLQTL